MRLTGAQARRDREIEGDLAQAAPMLRLLQGDVGSGKTLVAPLAMLIAVEAGAQAALLAPTEILARQHYATLLSASSPACRSVAILTGRDKGRAREAMLMGLADGSIDILVGTHAIFQEEVGYKRLGLVVVDEQHRFGVAQRMLLPAKAEQPPHLLVMTATPIPRTLTLTQYGEMDVSRLDEMPPGRQPIETRVISEERLAEVVDGARPAHRRRRPGLLGLPAGRGEREERPRRRRGARRDCFALRFGDRTVGLVHGRMKGAGEGRGDGAFASGRARRAGRHDGDRGRRRRAQCDADDHRTCRPLRPCPAPPAARAGRARRGESRSAC